MSDQAQVLRVFTAANRRHRAWPPLMDWIREHGADPKHLVAVEVLLLDTPFVRFHEIDVDDRGRPKARPGTRELALLPPRDVPLRRMPPERQAGE